MSTRRCLALLVVFLILVGGVFSYLWEQKSVPPVEEEARTAEVLKDYYAEERVNTAEVLFEIASAEDRLIEMEVDIKYSRYGDISKHFVLSADEAGDRAFSTVFISYRTVASEIPFSELITKEGKKLLHKRVWEEIEHFNYFPHEPVWISDVNVKKMIPDPDPESVGRPAMLFLNDESGDAKAGV